MILIIEQNGSCLDIFIEDKDGERVLKIRLTPDWKDKSGRILLKENVRAVGYVIHNGGDKITAPVTLINKKVLENLEESIKSDPEQNSLIYGLCRHMMKKLPKAKHVLLCETAFFNDLDKVAGTYAVPYKLIKKGVRRYGAFGLLHEEASSRCSKRMKGASKKILSIMIGNNTNIVATDKTKPVETSIGFSSLEGIISGSGCGDIDPTIIFQLNSAGLSFKEINNILSCESGFKALNKSSNGISDVISAKASLPYRMLVYSIMKYTGAYIAVLGGIDAIVFSYEDPRVIDLIEKICSGLDFLGLKCRIKSNSGADLSEISAKNSMIKVFLFKYDKWAVLRKRVLKSIE